MMMLIKPVKISFFLNKPKYYYKLEVIPTAGENCYKQFQLHAYKIPVI